MSTIFTADIIAPHPEKLEVWREPLVKTDLGALPWLGWQFVAKSGDTRRSGADFVDDSFAQIIGYIEDYHINADWRNVGGESVNLRRLQRELDESHRWKLATWKSHSAREQIRGCVNYYDEGDWRFTLERQKISNGMEWWEPFEWSQNFEFEKQAINAANKRLNI